MPTTTNPVILFSLIIAICYAYACIAPEQTNSLVAELRRRQRARVTWREGLRIWREFGHDLDALAAATGKSRADIIRFLLSRKHAIINEFGSEQASQLLGEPESFDRFF